MKKNFFYKSFIMLCISIIFVLINSCRPAVGTPLYPRSTTSDLLKIYVTEIKVAGNLVTPELKEVPTNESDAIKKFSESDVYIVNLPANVDEVLPEHISVKAVYSLSSMEPVPVKVSINGDGTHLAPGHSIPITIKISSSEGYGQYVTLEKIIKVTQEEPYDLELSSLNVCEIPAISDSVSVPYKEAIIDASKIKAVFNYGGMTTVIPVEVAQAPVELKEGEPVKIKFFVEGKKGQYKDFEKTIFVTRQPRQDGEDEALQLEGIYVFGIKAEIGKAALVSKTVQAITADDIILSFKKFGYIPIKINSANIDFTEDILSLDVYIDAKAGKYQAWNSKLTLKKDPNVLYNPLDKKGNKKYIVKVNTKTEKISPFEYYNSDYEFPASKFDDWVVYIDNFDIDTNVASYRFKPGSWYGTPSTYDGPDFASGAKTSRNVKFYKYVTRKERWKHHGAYEPPNDLNDSRFYFYRFTANAGPAMFIQYLDNSMFCVDRYSKFLFYYSDPAEISNLGVPSAWMDYKQNSHGNHEHFDEPFYMSDPVGYVNEDGSVVMYPWIKSNISQNDYKAKKNTSYTKPAEKKSNAAGFSPYRNEIVTKKTEVLTTENPNYTVSQPIVLGQPMALLVSINSDENAVMRVKAAPVPEGETLSYKWYKNTIQSNEGGTLIPDAVSDTYTPDKTVETNCYIYCEVTNTYNGNSDMVKSDAVKLLITSGHLTTDAEQPRIIKEPESKSIPIKTSGNINLEAEAISMDMGHISYQWYQNSQPNTETGIIIDGKTESSIELNIDTSSPQILYYYCVVTNTNDKVDGKKTAERKSAIVKVEVEESYPLIFKVNNDNAGRIIALRDGKPIELGSYVKKGDKIQFLAFCNTKYETQAWEGAAATGNINLAEITINSEEDAKNTVCDMAYIPPGKLTVTAKKLHNVDIGRTSPPWEKDKYVYFFYDFRLAEYYDPLKPLDFKSIWQSPGGRKPTKDDKLVDFTTYLLKGAHTENTVSINLKYEYFKIDIGLIYYKGYLNWGKYYLETEQILSDYQQSIINFKYNRQSDIWELDNPTDFSIPNVDVEYDKNFTIAKGETKDFVISYKYKNSGDNYLNGTAKVTYEIKWE
ncbi:hypothetical protein E4O05_11835 [Treponema sp. OMZ 787]|uniref:hypothetical protein n=1 Tax=Treponema sp. OMZ 787 TaxID=2563669 RepID=UPI0020A4B663|nr:hypothetical protein [Treponema sp. OMZ 787]UTC62186.1 hypothetical protein E4O05_11835 [Treponema sp. OMZ 787]